MKKHRRRHKNKFSNLTRHQQPKVAQRAPAPPIEPPALNLGFHEAATLVTRPFTNAQIVVAGCGGIGAYVVQHIGRLMRVLYHDQKGLNLTLVDPDVVEEKNLGRQLFCDAEIGQPKAVALASRYGQAWGLNTLAVVDQYSERFLMPEADLIILVGCVDNAAARAELHKTLERNPETVAPWALPQVWWLDCGNLKDTGRVMLGSAFSAEQVRGSFVENKLCLTLPSPGLQYPDLLIPRRDEIAGKEMSCAELQAANLQSLNINAAVAVQAADFLTRMLVTLDLKRYQGVVNLASGSVKSFYITPDEVAREIQQETSFVIREDVAVKEAAA